MYMLSLFTRQSIIKKNSMTLSILVLMMLYYSNDAKIKVKSKYY